MGPIEAFTVYLEGGKRTFYPGQIINGTVFLKINEDLKLRGVRIEFRGRAEVRWTESSGSGEDRSTNTYDNEEDYINTIATIYGNGAC